MIDAIVVPKYMLRVCLLLVNFTLMSVTFPATTHAQNIVVAKMRDKTRRRKLGRRVTNAIRRVLENSGVNILAFQEYLSRARSEGINRRYATSGTSVHHLAATLDLAGIVVGEVKRKHWRYVVTIHLIDSSGNLIWRTVFETKRPFFGRIKAQPVADKVIQLVQATQRSKEQQEASNLAVSANDIAEIEQVLQPEQAAAKDQKPTELTEPVDPFDPVVAKLQHESALTHGKKKTISDATHNPANRHDRIPAATQRITLKMQNGEEIGHTMLTEPLFRWKNTPFNDMLLSTGATLHIREGLIPVHRASFFPGVRVDGHFFLGALTNKSFLRNLGVGAMYDRSFHLNYDTQSRDGTVVSDAVQVQWRAELIYRIPYNVIAFLLRTGYGTTRCVIAAKERTNVFDVEYVGPYANVEWHLRIVDAFRLYFSGGLLFKAEATRDLVGSGLGYSGAVGLNMTLSDHFHLGIGYEITHYVIQNADSNFFNEYTDTFQTLFTRFGYNYQ